MPSFEYYAKDRHGNEIYKKNSNGHQYYANVADVTKIFAKKYNGQEFYAQSKRKNEFYPYLSGRPVYIIKSEGTQVYAKRNDTSEIYPRTIDGKELLLLNHNRRFYYAKDKNGNEKYPKMPDGKEYMPYPDRFTVQKSGEQRYPLDENQKPIYPVDVNGKQTYILTDSKNEPIFGKDSLGNQYYAKDPFSNEYYPGINMVAKNHLGEKFYAISHDQKIIYPKNNLDNEFYLETSQLSSFEFLEKTGKKYDYAKMKNNREIYPRKKISKTEFMEIILNNRYAKNENGKFYYPRDEFGNEYVMNISSNLSELDIFPNGYPITKDSFYIIPNLNGQAYLLSKNSKVQIQNISAKLYRNFTKYKDFLTNVKSNRKSSSSTLNTQYNTLPINNLLIKKYNPANSINSKNWKYCTLAFLSIFILFIFIKMLS